MPRVDACDAKISPKFSRGQCDRLLRFGQQQRYAKDQPLFVTGQIALGIFVLKTGRGSIFRRSGRGSYRSSRRSISPLESSMQSAAIAIIKITYDRGEEAAIAGL